MSLTENLNLLSRNFPDTFEKIKDAGSLESNKEVRVEKTRNGMITIVYKSDSGEAYIHSKYDPVTEAERLIGQYKDIDRYKHVFFYGVGMGYHVEEFCRNWPDKKFILYEPEQSILWSYLKEMQLEKLPMSNCKGIYTGSSQGDIGSMLQQYVNQINGEVLFIILPSYERIFADKYKYFLDAFRTAISNKRASLQAQMHFQKLWTTNSIKNFREVISSPNMLQDKKRYFAGKPAIIAAAGPSLEDELENLRLIKEKGLAYVFAAGSSINTLLINGIYPHGVCTYDPAPHNLLALESFIKAKDVNIPLIYGSSTYYKVTEQFSGRKYHIISDKDSVAQFYLKNETGEKPEVIMDSPSITIMLLQILTRLGCDPIILVGQNFAFKSNKYYADGIEYAARPSEISEVEQKNAVIVDDVHGKSIYTNITFNHMRRQMEDYLRYFSITNVINCTGGGAKIEGTVYKSLKELLEEKLSVPTTVEDWMEDQGSSYDISYMIDRNNALLLEHDRLFRMNDRIINNINELKSLSKTGSDKAISSSLSSFDKELNGILKNEFFNIFLRPMNRVQLDIISRNVDEIRSEKNLRAKAEKTVEGFEAFIEGYGRDLMEITSAFYENSDYITDNDIKVLSFTVQIA